MEKEKKVRKMKGVSDRTEISIGGGGGEEERKDIVFSFFSELFENI